MKYRKIRRDQCVVLPLVLKGEWYRRIESGKKGWEWRRAEYWLKRVYRWNAESIRRKVPAVVEFRLGYASDAPRMAFVCGWQWDKAAGRWQCMSPAYLWKGADWPCSDAENGETAIARVGIFLCGRVELIGEKPRKGGKRK